MTNVTYLAIDASCAEGFAALIRDQGSGIRDQSMCPLLPAPQSLIPFSGGRARDCAAAEAIAALCKKHPETPIDAVVVGIGPGSYNGLRSSLAAAWGFAFARNIPLTGVSSWLALAEGDFAVTGDARQNQIAYARVSNGTFVVEPHILSREEALKKITTLDAAIPLLCPAPCGFPAERQCTPQPHLLVRAAESEHRLLACAASEASKNETHRLKAYAPLCPAPCGFPSTTTMPKLIYLKPPHVTCASSISQQV